MLQLLLLFLAGNVVVGATAYLFCLFLRRELLPSTLGFAKLFCDGDQFFNYLRRLDGSVLVFLNRVLKKL